MQPEQNSLGRIEPSRWCHHPMRLGIAAILLCILSAGLRSQTNNDTPPSPDEPLLVRLDYAKVVDDEVRVAISFRADTNHNYVVESREQLQADSDCDHWEILPAAPHNFGIVFATNTATEPQRLYRLRRIERQFNGLFALLVHDTGNDPYDGLTSDPTVSGLVVPSEPNLVLQAGMDGLNGRFTSLRTISRREHFKLQASDLADLNQGRLKDGPHTLYLRTINPSGSTLQTFELPFVLDTTAPSLSIALDSISDTPPIGDQETTLERATLVGHTQPGLGVGLRFPELQVVADAQGNFRFEDLPLEAGQNRFVAYTRDAACNEVEVATLITRAVNEDCPFLPGLPGWRVDIAAASGREGALPGTIQSENCTAVLREGDSFLVALERTFVIPDGAGLLCIRYETPSFDSSANDRMRDAFEAALVDDQGQSLVFSIQGQAGLPAAGALGSQSTLPPRPEAFFNHTDGRTPFAAPGVALSQVGPRPATIYLDVRRLPAGTRATLALRLLNNDFDRESSVRIVDVAFKAFDGTLDYRGTEPPALSTLLPDSRFQSGFLATTSLEELSPSVGRQFLRSSLNEASRVMYADVALQNSGTFPLKAPLWVGVRNLTDPSVRLLGADGITGDGIPVYDFTPAMREGLLAPAESSLFRTLAFANPNEVQFDYQLVVLGQLNRPPAFTTTPVIEAIVDRPYRYAFHADDPDGDPLTYSLLIRPTGLSLNLQRLALDWTPTSAQIGTHTIVLTVDDGRGGHTEQRYTLSVTKPPPNRPPIFTSFPVNLVTVGQAFSYAATATDPDGDPIDFRLVSAPSGMTIDPTTGQVDWSPSVGEIGDHAVAISAGDGRGGNASQNYTVSVLPDPINHPPVIVSEPTAVAFSGKRYSYRVKATDPDKDVLHYSLTAAPTGMTISADSGLIQWNAPQTGNPDLPDVPGYTVSVYASLVNPIGLAFGLNGVLYCGGDQGELPGPDPSSKIRRIEVGGSPVIDYSVRSLADPDAVAFDATGKVSGVPGTVLVGGYSEAFSTDSNIKAISPDGVDRVLFGGGPYINPNKLIIDSLGRLLFTAGTVAGNVQTGAVYVATGPSGVSRLFLSDLAASSFAVDSENRIYTVARDRRGTDDLNDDRLVIEIHSSEGTLLKENFVEGLPLNIADPSTGFIGSTLLAIEPPAFCHGFGLYLLHNSELFRCDENGNQVLIGRGFGGQATDMVFGPDGALYISMGNGKNRILRLSQLPEIGIQVTDGRGGFAEQCYRLDVIPAVPSEIHGTVFHDINHDGAWQEGAWIYWSTGSDNDSVRRARLDGSCHQVVITNRTNTRFGGIAIDEESQHLFVGDTRYLYRADLDGANLRPILAAEGLFSGRYQGFTDLALDKARGKLYFSDISSIYSVNLDGSDPKFVVTPSRSLCEGIAVDSNSGTLYFTDTVRNRILYLNPGDPQVHEFRRTLFSSPWEVEFDDRNGVVYWSEYAGLNTQDSRLSFAPVAGGGQDYTAWTPPGGINNGFAFDPIARRVFYSDFIGLRSANPDGSDDRRLNVPMTTVNYIRVFHASPENTAEGTLGGRTVWIDTNRNGILDPGEPTRLSDECGGYSFAGLVPGKYAVRLQKRDGWVDTVGVTTDEVIQLGVGDINRRIDLGSYRISTALTNHPPQFVSRPPIEAVVGQLYRYVPMVVDPDGDPLTFAFPQDSNRGAVFDQETGALSWMPQQRHVGVHDFLIVATDPDGEVALQYFEVHVRAANGSPIITSRPNGPVAVGRTWQYLVIAQDPESDPISFTLGAHPAGMTMDPSGLVIWAPGVADVGIHDVAVTATDSAGGSTTQSFELLVAASGVNRPPQITSRPRTSAGARQDYLYELVASDPDGDPLTLTLTQHPNGMVLSNSVPAAVSRRLVYWRPEGSEVGLHPVELQVSDGHATVSQRFNVEVTVQAANQPPRITSTPLAGATVGQLFAYDAQANDPDGDPLTWDLETGPTGASMDATSGTLRWSPTLAQLGSQSFVIRVADYRGGFSTQSFTVLVRASNLSPLVLSAPPTRASTNQPYSYAVQGSDPEGGPLTYALTTAPVGMGIEPGTGLIQWTPTSGQLGTNDVEVRVTDLQGAGVSQSYQVVVTSEENGFPAITSLPPFVALIGAEYRYPVAANDPESEPLTFSLLVNPGGMGIEPGSGLMSWTPTAAQQGAHRVIVAAVDPKGAAGTQEFTVTVVPENHPPRITSAAVQQVPADSPYRYDIRAIDPDGDPISYSLNQSPSGMTLDSLGRLRWLPTRANAGIHRITLTAADPLGGVQTQTFDLRVTADTTPPAVRLARTDERLPVGAILEITAVATDNVGVASLVLMINGVPIPLDSQGHVELSLDHPGVFEIMARATDLAGNTAQDGYTLTVYQTTIDPDAPVVELINPVEGSVLTAPINVIGTANDANLLNYTLAVRRADQGESQFQEIARSTTPVINSVLGRLDVTTLASDNYVLRLTATDQAGTSSLVETTFSVAGELKVGNFRLSFTDLTIPLNGVPIVIGRSYDTLDAGDKGDFGHGWRLEFRAANLRNSLPPRTSVQMEFGIYPPFTDRTRVYVTMPGGRREAFTFKPIPQPGFAGSFWGFHQPAFVPDAGVTSSLTVPIGSNVMLQRATDGSWNAIDSNGGLTPYNPDDPVFGGTYTLITKEGLAHQIDATTREVTEVVDVNGNTLNFTDAAVIHSSGQKVTLSRDPQGRIIGVTDPAGKIIRYEYDARGDLVSVTDRENNKTWFEYGAARSHYLTRVIDPLGRTAVRTEYDESGRLVRLTDAAGNPVQLIHDIDQSTEQVVDALGHTNTFVYDGRGNVVLERNALGGITQREYDQNNFMTLEVDALGHTNRFRYDGDGNVTEHTDPLGNVTRSTYLSIRPRGWFNFNGRAFSVLHTTVDPLGNTTQNTYDDGGNLISTRDALGNITQYASDGRGNQTSITDALGKITSFNYDSRGRLLDQTDALGNVNWFTYDGNGNQIRQTTLLTIRPGVVRTNVVSTTYDANGRPTSNTDAAGNTTRTEYDALGHTAATVDALGHRTEFVYDDRGQLVATRFADGTVARTEYDAGGRRTASVDRAGRVTRFVYDALGRLLSTIYPDDTPADDADNPRTRIEYDRGGRVISQTDERGNSTFLGYDDAGRQTSVTNALGFVSRSEYDNAGRKISELDPLNRRTRFVYDALGRRLETRFADSTSKRTLYDALGRVWAEVDQVGVTNRFEYDALGRLTAVVDALNHRTEYAYDEAGHLVRQQDANGHVTRYEYETCCQRSATILPMGQRSSTVFNAVNGVSSTTDFNGRTIQFDYDANNRLQTKRFPDGTTVAYAYTPTGRRRRIAEPRGVTTFEYDTRDRLLRRTDPDGRFVAYTYDTAGNRTSVTTATGITRYEFDALNRMTRITDPDGGITHYTYDPVNNVILQELPNGTVRANAYDALNRVNQIEHRAPGGPFARYEYTLNPNGNRLELRELDGRRVNYAYDPLHRLVQETIADPVSGPRTIAYVMDGVGNRLLRNDSVEGQTTYTYDANDQLLSETLDSQASTLNTRYTYDANGNTLSKSNANESTEYEWNPENRLIAFRQFDASHSPLTTGQYQYDTDGIRVSSTVTEDGNATETVYLVDANRPFAQVLEVWQSLNSQPSTLNSSYTYGHHQPISQSRAGVRTYYHADHLGSTRALTGATGSPTDGYVFDAYGRTLRQTGPTANDYLFAGEQRDKRLGLDYLRMRYLNFNAGRLYVRDPIAPMVRRPSESHSFTYAAANPVSATDPTGGFTLAETVTVAAVQSAIEGNYHTMLVKSLRDTLIVARFKLKPGADLQEKGLRLMVSGEPLGYDLYVKGRELSSVGFGELSGAFSKRIIDLGKALTELGEEFDTRANQKHCSTPAPLVEKAGTFFSEMTEWLKAFGFLAQEGGYIDLRNRVDRLSYRSRIVSNVLATISEDDLYEILKSCPSEAPIIY